jgi:hypothetical protein
MSDLIKAEARLGSTRYVATEQPGGGSVKIERHNADGVVSLFVSAELFVRYVAAMKRRAKPYTPPTDRELLGL